VSEPIIIPPLPIGKDLADRIAEHNWHVEFTWRHIGSRCKPANAKRAAHGKAALSELQRSVQILGPCTSLRSDGSSPTCLTNTYNQDACS
jgi:hypothetical protein